MFNKKEVGEMIRQCRNELDDSLEAFADKIHITRQTLSRWEKGDGAGPSVEDFDHICQAINCDIGYLFGEYPCKKRSSTDIHQVTGLSEPAILTLCGMNSQSKRFLDELLCNPSALEALAHTYCMYRDSLQFFSGRNGKGLTNFTGQVHYSRANGQEATVPLSEMHQFARFELLHEVQNFADRNNNE